MEEEVEEEDEVEVEEVEEEVVDEVEVEVELSLTWSTVAMFVLYSRLLGLCTWPFVSHPRYI